MLMNILVRRMVLAIIIVYAWININQATVVHVHKRGRDEKQCLQTGYIPNQDQPRRFCHSLEFVSRELGNISRNVSIILETGIKLKRRVTFEDYDYLSIQVYV